MSTKKLPAKRVEGGVPAHFSNYETGAENINGEDIIIPRLKICQPTSAEAKRNNPDLSDGMYYNHAENLVIGKSVSFFVLLEWKSRTWFTDDFKLIGSIFRDAVTKEMIKVGPDIDAILSDKQRYEQGIDGFNYMIILEKELRASLQQNRAPMFMIFACQSAAMKTARQLNGKIFANSQRGIPIWGQVIKAGTTLEKYKKGSAFQPSFSYGRFAEAEESEVLDALSKRCRAFQSRSETHTEESHKKETKEEDLF